MKEPELIERIVQRPQNFAWLLGAGASRSSGLPTAADILSDLKRRHYCAEQNQKISRQDMQNPAVRARIQSFMDSLGFPEAWSEHEYTTYFEKIFGDDKERQRKYINAILAEDKVSLSLGNRVLGALMSEELAKVVFTTNFDSVVEQAVSAVSSRTVHAYHLEAAHNAKMALDNEEYPFYCKLHGDFRYDSIKNLTEDLLIQNQDLSACFLNAGNRFGFIVTGYSGRDESVMKLFYDVLDSTNPFPHGLFWTGIRGSEVSPKIKDLMDAASKKGVIAEYIEIETYDSFMSRLWRNISGISAELNSKVRKARLQNVNVPFPDQGNASPLLRLNALPLVIPEKCYSLTVIKDLGWDELRDFSAKNQGSLFLTKSNSIWCWGEIKKIKSIFNENLKSINEIVLPQNIKLSENLHVKAFLEEALCASLSKENPLLYRTKNKTSYLIIDPHTDDVGNIEALFQVVGKTSDVFTGFYVKNPYKENETEQVSWSESLRISIEYKNGKHWLLVEPDIWIWPSYARREQKVKDFLKKRRSDQYNKKYCEMLDAWIQIIFNANTYNKEVAFSPFARGEESENPLFVVGNRTAYSRRNTV